MNITQGYNLVWSLASIVGVVVFWRVALHSPWPRARRIAWALSAMCLGPAANKMFWFLQPHYQFSTVHSDWLIIPFGIATFGLLYAIHEVANSMFSRYWFTVTVIVVLVFLVGASFSMLQQELF